MSADRSGRERVRCKVQGFYRTVPPVKDRKRRREGAPLFLEDEGAVRRPALGRPDEASEDLNVACAVLAQRDDLVGL
jgi:hypothetical protein